MTTIPTTLFADMPPIDAKRYTICEINPGQPPQPVHTGRTFDECIHILRGDGFMVDPDLTVYVVDYGDDAEQRATMFDDNGQPYTRCDGVFMVRETVDDDPPPW